MRLEIEEAYKVKKRFLSNVSHELKTPLNSIIGFSDYLFLCELNDEQRECIEKVKESSIYLLEIINNILEFSKIEARKQLVFESEFNIKNTLINIAEMAASLYSDKNIKHFINISGSVPELIKSDHNKIRQILVNLLSNAFKFTDAGSVIIDVDCRKTNAPEIQMLEIAVKDTGIGIAEDKFDEIFEEFHQLNESNSRSHEGMGLGLSITKYLVELLNGRIYIKSILKIGSCFIVELPIRNCQK